MSPDRPDNGLPELLPMEVRPAKSRARQTRFESVYEAARAQTIETFGIDEEMTPQDIVRIYGPEDARDYIAVSEKKPRRRKPLWQEAWTLAEELQRNGGVLPGDPRERTLYPTQTGHINWFASHALDGDSFHFLGAPGTGKTLAPCAAMMLLLVRQQLRGAIEGKIAFVTAKSNHLSGKLHGGDDRKRRLLRTPPYEMTDKDWAKILTKLRSVDSDFMSAHFPKKAFMELLAQDVASMDDARRVLDQSLEARGLKAPEDSEAFVMLQAVLANEGKIVRGPGGTFELLAIDPPPRGEEEVLEAMTGDVGYVLPENYPVFARESTGMSTAERGDAKVILDTATLFTSSSQISRHGGQIHASTEAIVCDEAMRRNAVQFQEPVHTASGGKVVPSIFVAGSQRYANRKWDLESPSISWAEAIRRGILSDVGVQFGPSAKAAHYPSESAQAVDQLVAMMFETIRLYKELDIPQPVERNTVVVVHAKLLDRMTNELRAKYPKNADAQVRPYVGDDEDKAALEEWFDTPRDGPNILVMSSAEKLSLHLASIRRLILATRVTADALFHLTGRLAHAQGDMKKHDRVLLGMQQFADSNINVTPFTVFNHGREFDENGFLWPAGQILMSEKGYERDRKITRGKEKIYGGSEVPGTARRKKGEDSPINVQPGQMLVARKAGSGGGSGSSSFGAHITAAIPASKVRYDPDGPAPAPSTVSAWVKEVGGDDLYGTYGASIRLCAEGAHNERRDPRAAVHAKIAQLRERAQRFSSNGNS